MEDFANETAMETQAQQNTAEQPEKKCKKKCAIKAVLLIAIIALLLCNLFGCLGRKYDYAVMFSENAVATLNEVKQGGWDIINARWAADSRGVWNYELIVRRPAPLFGIFGKKLPKQAQPAPQQGRPAPQAQPAPAQPEAPKK